MKIQKVNDKNKIANFCKQNVFLHIYSLGDLDDFFWPKTSWYALTDQNEIRELILVYSGCSIPVLLGLSDDVVPMRELLFSIRKELPENFYAHLSPGLEESLSDSYELQACGAYYKMGLKQFQNIENPEKFNVINLNQNYLDKIKQLYEKAYPENWFDSRMLETDQYFGIEEDGSLVCVAGVHVYSKEYRVAALGNIATDPLFRKRSYAKLATAKLCQSLIKDVDHIGLNVKADNHPAISCYKSLGFENIAPYGEFVLNRK